MQISKRIISIFVLLLVLAFGVSASPFFAHAEQRSLVVKLVDGSKLEVNVEGVAPGTPASQIQLPELPEFEAGIVSISDQSAPKPSRSKQTKQNGTAPNSRPGTGANSKPEGEHSDQSALLTDPKQRAAERKANTEHEAAEPLPAERERSQKNRITNGQPTTENPSLSIVEPGAVPVGVPNFMIEKFRIPLFLLPIYQAAGIEYNVPWQILASINEIETDYGRNLSVSSAGALGWMQFMPATWKAYGVDANNNGKKDPYNPVDAIFAAARYLRAAVGKADLYADDAALRKAIFAYNHADWYVDQVLMRAKLIGGMPPDLVDSLTGLTQGHFPIAAKARYADDVNEQDHAQQAAKSGSAAQAVESDPNRRSIRIFTKAGAPVIAVNDGKIVKLGDNHQLGKYVVLQDSFGNTFTYAHLVRTADRYPVLKRSTAKKLELESELDLPKDDVTPQTPANDGTKKDKAIGQHQPQRQPKPAATPQHTAQPTDAPATPAQNLPVDSPPRVATDVAADKERLFASPKRKESFKAGGKDQLLADGLPLPDGDTLDSYFSRALGLDREDVELKPLAPGAKVIAGTVLGWVGKTSNAYAPSVEFMIRPAGRGAPRIDPKPILDGWKLLESTAVYRAAGKNPFVGKDAQKASIGQIMLMSKESLESKVLENARIQIYADGRKDIAAGEIDRRVLATLEYLAASGFRPTISSLKSGHGAYTSSGNVSHHALGSAVDIAAVNGVPIIGHQGKGSITDQTIQVLLKMQGTMKPAQIISLMTFAGADNTLSMQDHSDHIHVGWQPLYGENEKLTKQVDAALKPKQWIKLIDRLNEIDNPAVSTKTSKYALDAKPGRKKATDRASHAHIGE